MTIPQIVEELGLKSPAIVRQRLDLLDLSPELQTLTQSGQLSVAMAWGVAQAPVHHQARIVRDIAAGRLRTVEQVRHAGIAFRDAAAQTDAFGEAPRASDKDLGALSRLEHKIDTVAAMVQGLSRSTGHFSIV